MSINDKRSSEQNDSHKKTHQGRIHHHWRFF
jgi:hypothetical protein